MQARRSPGGVLFCMSSRRTGKLQALAAVTGASMQVHVGFVLRAVQLSELFNWHRRAAATSGRV